MMSEQKDELFDGGLVTVQRAAEFLGVGRTTVYGLMNSGKLPTAKIGKCVRIPMGAVKQFAQRSTVGANA
jgi:excisionase family DNA binding protein